MEIDLGTRLDLIASNGTEFYLPIEYVEQKTGELIDISADVFDATIRKTPYDAEPLIALTETNAYITRYPELSRIEIRIPKSEMAKLEGGAKLKWAMRRTNGGHTYPFLYGDLSIRQEA
jgi:hypothetical protein